MQQLTSSMRVFSIPIFSKILGEVCRSRTSPLITIDLAGPVIRRARFILSSSKAQSIIVERLPSRSGESFFSWFRSERSPGDANGVSACCCLLTHHTHCPILLRLWPKLWWLRETVIVWTGFMTVTERR